MTWCLRGNSRRIALTFWLCLSFSLFSFFPLIAGAQETQHVVSLDQLHVDSKQATDLRQANESAIRRLLSSEIGQKALETSDLDYRRVDGAIAQLSDEDVAKLAERSRQAQRDFAAGRIADRDLLWIIVIILAVIVIALVLR